MLSEEYDDDVIVWMSNKCSTKEIEDDNITIVDNSGATHNLQERTNTAPRLHPTRLQGAVQYAISDSGATGHFLLQGAPVFNKRPTASPLKITLPNGKSIQSTHTCNLDISWLPDVLTEAHIVHGLSHLSLISTRKFADAGCKVLFYMNECRVHCKGALVLTGKRDKATRPRNLTINPQENPTAIVTIENLDLHTRPNQHVPHEAKNVHTLPYLQNRMKYMH